MKRRKAIFIDRGGVIHQEFGRQTTGKPSDLVFEPGALSALKAFSREPFLIFLVDNPEEIALGHYSELAHNKLTKHLMNILRRRHIRVDGIYSCAHHPKGKGKYRRDSVFRFPNIGLLKRAQQEHELDLTASWLIGDRTREILAGQRAQCRTILVRTGFGGSDREFFIEPDAIAKNLRKAIWFIKEQELALTR